MAVAPDQVATMIGPMRDQLAQAEHDGAGDAAPDDIAEARSVLDQMEAIGADCADLGEFSQVLSRDGWWQRFTDPYTRALVAAGEQKYGGGSGAGGEATATGPDDATMLANMITAFETSIDALRGTPDEATIVPVLQEVVQLGRSGLSFPMFLRELVIRGIDQQVLSLTVQRHHLAADVDQYRTMLDPARQQMAAALLAAYDSLAGRNEFGAVDPLEYDLARTRVEWERAPAIARQDYVSERIPLLMFVLMDWLDAHTSWAPSDERFAGDNAASTRENIERTKACNSGFFQARLALLDEAIGLTFDGLFDEPIFPQARANGGPYFSDERVAIARALAPHCVPGAEPPADLLARAEAIGPNR